MLRRPGNFNKSVETRTSAVASTIQSGPRRAWLRGLADAAAALHGGLLNTTASMRTKVLTSRGAGDRDDLKAAILRELECSGP